MSLELKQQVAAEALRYVENDMILGVGTGSTVNCFIDALGKSGRVLEGAVSSSDESTKRLKALGIPVLDANSAGPLPLYIDGADEIDPHLRLIKGGGGALTREKIIAEASERFICIADASKQVDVLGKFPLPVEVIPMARSLVARAMVKLGGQPLWREDCVTDNGNWILDVHNLDIIDPVKMEQDINQIPGVVTVGLFAHRPADVALIAGRNGIEVVNAQHS